MKYTFRKLSVLMVDSIPSALDTQEAYLEPLDFYRVWTAKKVDEAMGILDQRDIHVVISAWKMQPYSGLQFVEMIRKKEKLAELPVILIADRVDQTMRDKAGALGVGHILSHPLKADAFRDAVVEALEPTVDFDEEEFMAHMDAARKALRKDKLDEAEEAYRAALGVKMDEDAYNGLAKVLVAKGDTVAAARCYMEAIKANPLSLKAFLGLAHIYTGKGRLKDALTILGRAVDAARTLKEGSAVRAHILFYMGELELQLKNLKRALGYFEEASEATPEDARLQSEIGDSLAESGHLEESEEFYRKALVMDPELAHVYNRLAIAYRQQEKYELAVDLYNKALVFHPEDENLMYNLGRCLWEKGDLADASDQLSQALEINPDFEAAVRLLDVVMRQAEAQANLEESAPSEDG